MVEESTYPREYETQREVGGRAEGGPPATSADYGAQAGSAVSQTARQMASFMDRFAEVAKADAAVGRAETVQGHTMVPLATVSAQAGFGLGFGGGGGTDEKRNQGGGSGGGGGGAGRGSSRVIAVVDISDVGVQVRPVPDVTALALAFMALVGLRMLSRRGGERGAARGRLLGLLRRD